MTLINELINIIVTQNQQLLHVISKIIYDAAIWFTVKIRDGVQFLIYQKSMAIRIYYTMNIYLAPIIIKLRSYK